MSKLQPLGKRSKAGVIRQALVEIAAWRDAGISSADIAVFLSERSGQTITLADVYRETYRGRLRRKKGGQRAGEANNATSLDASAVERPPLTTGSELANRLRERGNTSIEFNPKPDPNDLI